MADEADMAAARIEAFQAQALAATLRRPAPTHSNGICRNCGEAIESDRLKVQPHASACAECAGAMEEDRARFQRRGF